MRFHRIGSALQLIAIFVATSSIALWLMASARRDERLIMAAYYQQKEAESLKAASEERHIADLADGKVGSPILPFLNPIGEPGPHRVAAIVNDDKAIQYGRMSREYTDAAARPWRSVNLTGISP